MKLPWDDPNYRRADIERTELTDEYDWDRVQRVRDGLDTAKPGDVFAYQQPNGNRVTAVNIARRTAARTERYKAKSNGSCGQWVWSDESVAVCTCPWKSYAATRAEAQAAARSHRMEAAA